MQKKKRHFIHKSNYSYTIKISKNGVHPIKSFYKLFQLQSDIDISAITKEEAEDLVSFLEELETNGLVVKIEESEDEE